jgi:hypothetical protein
MWPPWSPTTTALAPPRVAKLGDDKLIGLPSVTICDQTFTNVRLCALTGPAAAICPATSERTPKAASERGPILFFSVKVVGLPSGHFPPILVGAGVAEAVLRAPS